MHFLLGFFVWLAAMTGFLPDRRRARVKRSKKEREARLPVARAWAIERAEALRADVMLCASTGALLDADFMLDLAQIESIASLWAPRRSIAIIAGWRSGVPEEVSAGQLLTRLERALAILAGPRTKRLARACLAPKHLRLAPGARIGRLRRRLAPVAAAWRLAALLDARRPFVQALELSG